MSVAEKNIRRSGDEVQAFYQKHRAKSKAYDALCRREGLDPAHVALAWLLANPIVTAPIIGPRTLEQLEGTLISLSLKLSEAILKELDVIWPGPGGEAPEAYAW
jgi:aryl-alcohol dehydrogenase-like predicted oxidoreductase